MFCVWGDTFSLAQRDACPMTHLMFNKAFYKKNPQNVSHVVILEPKRGLKSLFHADGSLGTQTLQLPVADRSSNKAIRHFSEFTVHFTVK